MAVINKRKKKTAGGKIKEIEALMLKLYQDQFNEDTPPADQGEMIELLVMIVDYLKTEEAK